MKSPDYAKIKHLIDTNYITDFSQIFQEIKKKTVYTDLSMGFQALDKRLADPSRFTLRELATLANLIGVDPILIVALALKKVKIKKK